MCDASPVTIELAEVVDVATDKELVLTELITVINGILNLDAAPRHERFPFTETSDPTHNFEFIDTSPATNNLLFNDASEPKNKREFMEASPLLMASLETYKLPLTEASPVKNKRPFTERSCAIIS